MLRVEVDDSANTLSLRLQGRLVGEDAKSTRTLMKRYRSGMKVVVDLTEVTFVDAVGEELLSFFSGFAAQFIAETSYSRYMCERLHLRLVEGEPSDANTPATLGPGNGRRMRLSRRPLVGK